MEKLKIDGLRFRMKPGLFAQFGFMDQGKEN
jgi:hypothetical protein